MDGWVDGWDVGRQEMEVVVIRTFPIVYWLKHFKTSNQHLILSSCLLFLYESKTKVWCN